MSKQCGGCTKGYGSEIDGMCKYCRWDVYRHTPLSNKNKRHKSVDADALIEFFKDPGNSMFYMKRYNNVGRLVSVNGYRYMQFLKLI